MCRSNVTKLADEESWEFHVAIDLMESSLLSSRLNYAYSHIEQVITEGQRQRSISFSLAFCHIIIFCKCRNMTSLTENEAHC